MLDQKALRAFLPFRLKAFTIDLLYPLVVLLTPCITMIFEA